ncbi:hypothetical protein D1BOALGB6SA_8102, partial [Olavius sp. associated proteobacterium Delta 1]
EGEILSFLESSAMLISNSLAAQ